MKWQGFAELFGINIPIIQAPMAGSQESELVIAVSTAGGLGSLPCAMLTPERISEEVTKIRNATGNPFNLNFFCHEDPLVDQATITSWRQSLAPYFQEFGLPIPDGELNPGRNPFNDELCDLVEQLKPPVISFHFGLPQERLYDRVRALGCKILCSATTTEEAVFLESKGVDAVIAQGAEAGGHRGVFLGKDITTQPGTFALVPQIADSISIPVIAAGGIGDHRGIQAAFSLGACCVQIGTAYLFTQQAKTAALHLEALKSACDNNTALTNLFSGRPARGVVNRLMNDLGPISAKAPAFPLAGADLVTLKANAESEGRNDFTSLWSGQSAFLARDYLEMDAGELTELLWEKVQGL